MGREREGKEGEKDDRYTRSTKKKCSKYSLQLPADRRRTTISRNDPERRGVGINWSRTRNTADVPRFLRGFVFFPLRDDRKMTEDDDDGDVPASRLGDSPLPRLEQKRPTGIQLPFRLSFPIPLVIRRRGISSTAYTALTPRTARIPRPHVRTRAYTPRGRRSKGSRGKSA